MFDKLCLMSGFTGCNNQILVKFQHIRQIPLELYFPGLVKVGDNTILYSILMFFCGNC